MDADALACVTSLFQHLFHRRAVGERRALHGEAKETVFNEEGVLPVTKRAP